MKSGIYQIRNLVNNKVYIGKSSNIIKRWSKHRKLLRENKHTNAHLQSAYAKYGLESFQLEIIELCEEKFLNERETHWISLYKSTDNQYGYNKVSGGTGGSLNTESLAKMVASLTGKKLSKSHKKSIGLALRGRKQSIDTKLKMSEASRGKNKSVEHKKSISETLKGRKLSLETRIKMSKARKGIKQLMLVCPHCSKSGGTTMYRWHFNNCKDKR